jgi:hypothetical protein
VAPEVVNRIVVIDNTARGMPARDVARLLADYGPHASRVDVVFRERIAPRTTSLGWTSQQVLKLAVARLLDDDRYVALDAKNVVVRPLDPGFFEAPDGRARVCAYPYVSHPLRPALERSLAYFGLAPEAHLARFPATVTPYLLYSSEVRDLIAEIEGREAAPFARVFVDRDFTEFFLYAAWLSARHGDRSTLYVEDQPRSPMVWPGHSAAADVAEAVSAARAGASPFFSVHRTALRRMDAPSVALVAALWADAGLFPSSQEAVEYIRGYRNFAARRVWAKRAREAGERFRRRVAAGARH